MTDADRESIRDVRFTLFEFRDRLDGMLRLTAAMVRRDVTTTQETPMPDATPTDVIISHVETWIQPPNDLDEWQADLLRRLVARVRELEAELDPPVCRLQFPDCSVPGNAREAAEGWKRWADEFGDQVQKLRKLVKPQSDIPCCSKCGRWMTEHWDFPDRCEGFVMPETVELTLAGPLPPPAEAARTGDSR